MLTGFIVGVVFSFATSTLAVLLIVVNHGITFEEESE